MDEIADGILGVIRGNDFGDGPAVNDVADGQWGFSRDGLAAHIHTHDGRKIDVVGFEEKLTVAGRRDRLFAVFEVLRNDVAPGSAGDTPLTVSVVPHRALSRP